MTRTPLVGRAAELARVGSALDAAVQGDPTFVLVLGEAGIGKTAFLRATAWLAASHGMRVLTGTAVASGSSIPYLPLMAPLRAAVDGLRTADASARTVRLALEGDESIGDPTAPAGAEEPDAARAARLIEAIYDVLARQPTLLIVDDAQWADAATFTVLDYLAHRAATDPLAVVVAARDDEPSNLRRLPIADGRRYLQLPLGRLTRHGVREQVRLLAAGSLSDSAIEVLFERSDGNPLYVEELMAHAASDDAASIGIAPPPTSLRSLVGSRVDELPDTARRVTEAIAVLDAHADADAIAVVADLQRDTAAQALAAADRAGVVVRGRDGYGLRHPLFGEVLAADLATQPYGAAMHRRAAELLTTAGASPAEVVRHWEACGDAHQTWSTSVSAGAMAEASSAFAEARLHFERAVAYWPDGVGEREAITRRAARAAWLTGETEIALSLAQAARVDGAEAPEALVAEAQYAWDAGQRTEAVEIFVGASELLDADSPPGTRAHAMWGLGRARIGQGDHADAYRLAVSAADLAGEAGSPAWMSKAWVLAGMARAWQGDIRGITELERGLGLALESGEPETIGHAFQFLTELLWLGGRLSEASRIGRDGVSTCDRIGLARSHGSDVRGLAAAALIDLGAWREAEEILEGADARARPTYARALLAVRRGEWEAAERGLRAAANEPAIGGRGRLGGLTELAEVEMGWLRGARDDALRALESLAEQPGIWGVDVGARKALWSARLGRPHPSAIDHFDVALADAVNAELEATSSKDLVAWTGAAAAWERVERPYEHCLALLSAAEAGYAVSDRQTGRASLDAAFELATRLGARPLVERAEALGRRARVKLGAPDDAPPSASPLTPREAEVLEQLAEGRTNAQIAQHLFLSPKTVGIHVSRVLEKLGSHTRGEAVATARRLGLLP